MDDLQDLRTGAGGEPPAPPLGAPPGPPLWSATLWPHRSMPRRGFRLMMIGAAAVMLIPLGAVTGTRVMWFILPFVAIDLALLWWLMARNYREGTLTEEVRVWPGMITVERREPGGAVRRWHANPYWVRVALMPEGGKVENYLTLAGNGRVIELGAFLSPDERCALRDEVETALARARAAA